jgi:hypothetical protein
MIPNTWVTLVECPKIKIEIDIVITFLKIAQRAQTLGLNFVIITYKHVCPIVPKTQNSSI